MGKKPIYYDGSNGVQEIMQSVKQQDQIKANTKQEESKVTDEMRKNISGNPYIFE